MPLERAEGLSRSGALRYQANPCPGPGGPGGGARGAARPGSRPRSTISRRVQSSFDPVAASYTDT